MKLLTDHIRTGNNVEADALSRLAEDKSVPQSLRGIRTTPPPDRKDVYRIMEARARTQCPAREVAQ